jgi:hypothetical protein
MSEVEECLSPETPTNYLEWNDRLAAHFFNAEMAGRPVYLFANNELISEIGRPIGGRVEDFVSAVKQGPPWVTHGELCQRALQALRGWRGKNRPFPPYVGYLCLFVLAAGAEGDFAPHAYYPRLRKILDYPTEGMLPSFNHMLELWDDLETWSTQDKEEELGIFTARIAGNLIHVGLPIAQTILTEHERKVLPRIFFRAGLDPTSTPPAEALARALRTYGPGELQRRTLNLLSTQGEREIYDVLLDIVAAELLEWDGHVEADALTGGGGVRSFAIVRLCLAFDSIANRAKCSLRLKINREFPEEGLLLTMPGMTTRIACEECVERWSTPLRHIEDGPLDAATVDWLQGTVFRDERLNWQFKLPGQPVRILTNGTPERLPGLVEIQALPRSEPFYLLYNDRVNKVLSPWLRNDCRGVRQFENVQGLPAGWQMVSIREAVRDSIRQQVPSLSFSGGRRIRFSGGLRISAGNTFFGFASPAVVVDGKDGTEQVFCNEQLLTPSTGDSESYELPMNLENDTRILITVKSGDFRIQRSLYLAGDFTWKLPVPARMFDRWGVPLQAADPRAVAISGAIVSGAPPDVSGFMRPLALVRQFDTATTSRVFYIGRRTGEIVSWPSEALPLQWAPIWAVPFWRRGSAVYCGEDPSASLPERDYGAPKERRDLWKEVLWHDRKRITPPRQRVLMKLWKRFIEAARDA